MIRMKMRKCKSCSNYTFEEECPKCGGATAQPLPPKYSPDDKYSKYRRAAKMKKE